MKKHLHNSLRALFLSLAVLMSLPMLAEEINGINYELNGETKQATVVSKSDKYSGDVVIPESVALGSTAYSVTSIGDDAFSDCSGLTSVTIPNSVTSIGWSAFEGCSGLTSVHISDIAAWCNIEFYNNPLTYAHHIYMNGEEVKDLVIPNSVTSIGEEAFRECSGLTSVTIPNSVTSIGRWAFDRCSGLTSVTIPNSVTSIGGAAFSACSGLTSVTIGNGVESIGEYAFMNCPQLLDVYCYAEEVPSTVNNAFYGSNHTLHVPAGSVESYKNAEAWEDFKNIVAITTEVDGINYDFNADTKEAIVIAKSSGEYSGSIVIPESVVYAGTAYSVTSIGENAFCGCPALTSVTIGNSVTSIEAYAFYSCSGLTSVTIGNGVESIGEYAFDSCDGLTSVIIGNSVTSIGNGAFQSCSDLTSVTIPNSVTSIGDGAFQSCSGLTSVSIPNSVTSIGVQAFDGCSGLTSVTIGNSVTSIGESAFFGCYGLKSVTIPNSVTSIGKLAFSYCPALKEMKVDANNPKYDSREGCNAIIETSSNTLISGCYKTVIPNSVTSIGESAFLNCSGLTSVTIPNSVESIGESAFQSCQGLTSVTIPNSVTSIGDYAFRYCSILSDVYCYAKNVPSIGSSAFYGSCPENHTLHVPAGSVESYKETAPWSDFKNIVELPPFSGEVEIDGINYELNGETKQATVIAKSSDKYSGDVVIPESVTHEGTAYRVTSIGEYAFDGCSGLMSVTIPNNVTSIGEEAFRDCSGLTSVTIPNSVASIGNYAFYHCSGLTSVHISDIAAWCNIDFSGEYPNPLEYAHHLYLNGEEVKDLVIPNSVTSIGKGAFSNCSGLTSVTIPNSVASIGEKAFLGCSGLTSVTIGNSVESIGSSAFLGCSALPSVTIPNSVKSIGNAAFSDCSDLTSVTIPNSVTSIGHTAFSNCSDLTSVTIGNGVTSIEWGAFLGCSGLTSVTIPNSVESIGWSAFEGCSGLTSVHISDIAAWCNIEFDDNPLTYAHHIYMNGEEVKDLVIPNSVTSIGSSAFSGCSGLTSVTIGNSVESIGEYAFENCSGLTSVTIPNSVTSIGSSAFNSCEGLTSVTIGNGVTSIGDRAFYYCYKLLDVYCYAEKVPSTESDAFDAEGIANATLHVPANAVKSYAASWTSFGTITGTVEVSSVGYATLFLDYDAEIPEGIEAYIAKEVVGENLKMEKVENQEGLLPAETGVIIKAEAGKYDFNLYPNANSVSVDGNLFVGSAIETEITAEDNTSYYILAAPDDNVGMYPVVLDENGAFVCKANKAYLPIPSAVTSSARIYFDFGTETRIVETENGELKTENCYDLAGRKVQGVQKGIYIVNGKKVIK